MPIIGVPGAGSGVPTDPTVSNLISAGMVEGGQYAVTSGQITNFQNAQFQDLKTLFWAAARWDRTLEKEVVIIANIGHSFTALPTDFDHVVDMRLYYPMATTWGGTATGGTHNTITIQNTFSAAQTDVQGIWVFITGGTGYTVGTNTGERGQITAYNDTTKVVTVWGENSSNNGDWVTNPDSTSTYMLGLAWRELKENQDLFLMPPNNIPRYYRVVGDGQNSKLYVQPAADSFLGPYAIVMRYGANLTRLSESDPLFVQHMRERRAYWTAGIKWKTASRYNDDREPQWKQEFTEMLGNYGAQNCQITRVEARR